MSETSEEQQEQINKKQGSVIKPCTCKHKYQDDKYGKGNRVWNYGKKQRRCTVCGTSVSEI